MRWKFVMNVENKQWSKRKQYIMRIVLSFEEWLILLFENAEGRWRCDIWMYIVIGIYLNEVIWCIYAINGSVNGLLCVVNKYLNYCWHIADSTNRRPALTYH